MSQSFDTHICCIRPYIHSYAPRPPILMVFKSKYVSCCFSPMTLMKCRAGLARLYIQRSYNFGTQLCRESSAWPSCRDSVCCCCLSGQSSAKAEPSCVSWPSCTCAIFRSLMHPHLHTQHLQAKQKHNCVCECCALTQLSFCCRI